MNQDKSFIKCEGKRHSITSYEQYKNKIKEQRKTYVKAIQEAEHKLSALHK